jgi:hypothetical protein
LKKKAHSELKRYKKKMRERLRDSLTLIQKKKREPPLSSSEKIPKNSQK